MAKSNRWNARKLAAARSGTRRIDTRITTHVVVDDVGAP